MQIYSLKNLPYTVRIRIKDRTVISRLPRKDTSQRGMLCKMPTSSIALTISAGSAAVVMIPQPMLFMDADTTLPQMEKIAVISSMPRPTATFAGTKRMKCRRANSGLCSSRKDAAEEKYR